MASRIHGVITGFFTRHIELKFLALLVALGLFYSREREEMADRTIQVDLMTTGEQEMSDRIRVSPLPSRIAVSVRGPSNAIAALREAEVGPIRIRIAEAAALGTVTIERSMLRLPDGVRVLELDPPEVRFRFEPRVQMMVPVAPEMGAFPSDVAAGPNGIGIDPPTVLVTGAQSSVQRIATLRTEPIDPSGWALGNHERTVRLELPDLPHVTVKPSTVRLQMVLVPDRIAIDRTGVPVDIVHGTDLDENGTVVYGAESRRVRVRIEGLRSDVESLSDSEIHLFARLDRASFASETPDGILTAEVPIEVQGGSERWQVVSVTPPTVRAQFLPPPEPEPTPDGATAESDAATAEPADPGR